MYPGSTRESERHDLETETYHYLGWSHGRIERTVDRLLGGDQSDPAIARGAAREIVKAFGVAGPPAPFWNTGIGRRCIEAGHGSET